MIGTHSLGMRILSLALCALCVFALALPAKALTSTQLGPNSSTEETAANTACIVHSYPSAGAQSIGYFENGTQITVKSTRGKYYRVDCYGMYGYIAMSQVERGSDGGYYVNCQANAADTIVMNYLDMSELISLRHALLLLGDAQLGTPYVYGGTTRKGFDCSGFTSYLYRQNGYSLLRRSSDQLQNGVIVSKESLQLGDLLFFREAGVSTLTSHVGIYAGNNKILHAGSKGICYADLDVDYFVDNYVGARRVLNAEPIRVDTAPTAITAAVAPSALGIRTVSEIQTPEE